MPLKVALQDIRPPGSDWIAAGTVFECPERIVEDLATNGLIAEPESAPEGSPSSEPESAPEGSPSSEPDSLVSFILDMDLADEKLWMKDGRPKVSALPEGTTGAERDQAWERAQAGDDG